MIKLLLYISFLFLFSCGVYKQDKNICHFQILDKNKPSSIKLLKTNCFVFNSDFKYPKHSYFLFTGPHIELISFAKNMGLREEEDSLVLLTNEYLNEYSNKRLWELEGYNTNKEDELLSNEFNINPSIYYAAYFNSGEENMIFLNPKNNWNGKIVIAIKENKCVIFIEELKSPQFIRVN